LLSLYVAIKLLWRARHFDVIVLDGGPIGRWFTLLAGLVPVCPVPVVMIDCLWYVDANPFKQSIKRRLLQFSARSVNCFVVWAFHEIEDYSKAFRIPCEKFAYLPFHTTIESYEFQVSDQGYIFAGGNGDRDYAILIEAVRGTDLPVFIAATDENLFAGIAIPDNVTVRGVSHDEFRKKMAGCSFAVVPMRGGLLHSGGQQTFLNSMAMGKATIIVGRKAAEGYVEDGVSGIVVENGNVSALREAILCLANDQVLRMRLAMAGKAIAASLSTDVFVRKLYGIASTFAKKRSTSVANKGGRI